MIVNGAVDPAGQNTTYHVLYDLSSSTWCSSNGTSGMPTYSTGAQTLPYTDGTLHNVSVNLTGLVGGTSDCASITATNASGTASRAVLSFTPDVVNTNVAITGPTTATINGAVNASGQTDFYYGAVYDLVNSTWCASNGSTPDATTVHDVGISFPYTDPAFHSVSVGLTALTPNTEYCVTLEAGLQAFPPLYFTTTGAGTSPSPIVATGSASGVGTGSATVSGTVNPNGTATTYHFDYGTSTNYGSQAPALPDPSAGSGTTAQTESTTLTGLSPNTLYHLPDRGNERVGDELRAGSDLHDHRVGDVTITDRGHRLSHQRRIWLCHRLGDRQFQRRGGYLPLRLRHVDQLHLADNLRADSGRDASERGRRVDRSEPEHRLPLPDRGNGRVGHELWGGSDLYDHGLNVSPADRNP